MAKSDMAGHASGYMGPRRLPAKKRQDRMAMVGNKEQNLMKLRREALERAEG